MKDKEQNKQPSNHPAYHFWEKPLGKILISVIAGTIVVFIGVGINRSCTPKHPTDNETAGPNKHNGKNQPKINQDTPEKIISEIQSVPPLQREDIAKTYIGIPVQWELYFTSGFHSGKEYCLLLHPDLGRSKAAVACAFPKATNEHLKRLQENTKVRVTGTIERVDSEIIFLKNPSVSRCQ